MALAQSWLRSIMQALATTLAAPLLLGGCLYTDGIQTTEEVKLAPSVARDATDPALEPDPVTVDPAVQLSVPFSILAIEDANVGDELRVRWFVDGGDTLYGEDVVSPDGSPVRVGGDVGVNLDISDFGPSPASRMHRVEAIISDHGWLHPMPNDPIADNRIADPQANVHYVFWEVKFIE
jgi:hypothetical protein